MFLHLFILVRQELLALSNLPYLLYQLDKGAAVLDFDILSSLSLMFLTSTLVAGAAMLLSRMQVEMYYKSADQ